MKKKYYLKKGVVKTIIYLIIFNLYIMLYNYNSYDLIIDTVLLIINILLYLFIKNSLHYYTIKIYLYSNKIEM